jgi:CheY-like chemotaxis protein
MNPKILLVDDNEDVLDSYDDLLGRQGYALHRARSVGEAQAALDGEGPWDVVLLDERLNGPGGGESATSVIAQVGARAPEARVIVITGFARKDLVVAALAAGAWDYLQKDEFLPLLLPAKVRQAVDAAVLRRLSRAGRDEIERDLRSTWQQSRTSTDRNEKGALLERTLRLLFHTLPGLEEVRTNWRSAVEEIDLVVRNASTDPLLAREGSLWLVECKNWSKPTDPQVVTSFRSKMRDRFGRVRLGLFIAAGGFTKNVDTVLARQSNEPELVVCIDGTQLAAWIDSSDRIAWLKDRLEATTLRG